MTSHGARVRRAAWRAHTCPARSLILASMVGLAACTSDPPSASPEAPTSSTTLPLPTPSPDSVDLVGGGLDVPSGTERMVCTHVRWDGDDVSFWGVETFQGQLGHHLELLTAKEPLAEGTVVDCSSESAMAGYDHFALSNLFLPTGYAMQLRHGQRLVLQSHYINPTPHDVTTGHDVARLRTTPSSGVTHPVSLLVSGDLGFQLPPHSTQTVTFGCRLDHATRLLLIGGHMHEWGSSFQLQAGPDDQHLTTVYSVASWSPAMRDRPPLENLFASPWEMPAGGWLRGTCAWNNTSDGTISYPGEMCQAFALVEGSTIGCTP